MTSEKTQKSDEPRPPEEMGYREAIEELESILAEIERDDVDLDRLSDRVERASAIIEYCRGRIEETDTRVRTLLDDLDATGDET
jgi:exodeoxyribonuclease VII small subunit